MKDKKKLILPLLGLATAGALAKYGIYDVVNKERTIPPSTVEGPLFKVQAPNIKAVKIPE